MSRLVRLAITALLLLGYTVLLVSAVAALAVSFFVAAVVVIATELWLSRRAPYLLPESLTIVLSARFRLLTLDVLIVVLAARMLPDAGAIVALAMVAVLLLAAGRDLVSVFARRVQWRRSGGPVSWRNLAVPGLPRPLPLREVAEPDAPFTLLTLLIPLGWVIGAETDRFGAAIAAQWIVIAVVLLVLAGRGVQYVLLNRRSHESVREAVRAAIQLHRPEVLVHHSGRRGTAAAQVRQWVPALLALERPCLIVVREQSHLDVLDGCGVPVVWAPRSQDLELFAVASVDLALYPSDSTNINNHLLRVPGVYDVLIGHGDSDEPESRNPIARMYDEVWVAGPAGAARYESAVSGVPASKVKQIGPVRPLLAPHPRAAASRPVVVYAPTWEGHIETDGLSSLRSRGRAILDALLARQEVQVVFAPSPATGARLPAFGMEVQRLRRLVESSRSVHRVVGPDEVREVLSRAAFAVVDVSPLLAEAVRADVPFAVPAIGTLSDDAMRAAYPSVRAGAILRAVPADVFAALDDALGPDLRAADRLALGRTIDSSGDFERRFREAVDDAIAAQRRRRAFARPSR